MRILGIHDGHGASACLLENGMIKYVLQEERLTNIKNKPGFPDKSIKTILSRSNLSVDDIDFIAMASEHMVPPPEDRDDLMKHFKRVSSFEGKILHEIIHSPVYEYHKKTWRKKRLNYLEKLGVPTDKVVFVHHHLAHASAAYYGAPWKDEPILVLTLDGSGDGVCAGVFIGEGGSLENISTTAGENSLGHLYGLVTFMLGFVPGEHEYKIMGMAPYAPEYGVSKAYDIFNSYLSLNHQDGIQFTRGVHSPTFAMYSKMRKDFELFRFDWIAGGIQRKTEEILVEWVKNCIKKTDVHKIACGGGVFMNVKANKKISELPEVDGLFVFPSCGDESLSIGAAYYLYAQKCLECGISPQIDPLTNLYFGDSFSRSDAEETIRTAGGQFEFEYVSDIEKYVSELLVDGKIVARCKGQMEFGARALGNRSILADPSNPKCIREINMMIKNRDFWMPFAPVILKEREGDYIVNPKNIPAPYMILTFDTTGAREQIIAAIHQADLTTRPQVIEREWNPEYYDIIKHFERETGIGGLLNTSFNLHGFPIVHGPKEALWTFNNSGLEYLALGDYLIHKS